MSSPKSKANPKRPRSLSIEESKVQLVNPPQINEHISTLDLNNLHSESNHTQSENFNADTTSNLNPRSKTNHDGGQQASSLQLKTNQMSPQRIMKRQIQNAIQKSGVNAFINMGTFQLPQTIHWNFQKIGLANKVFTEDQLKQINNQFNEYKSKKETKKSWRYIDNNVIPGEFVSEENILEVKQQTAEIVDQVLEQVQKDIDSNDGQISHHKSKLDEMNPAKLEIKNLPQIKDLAAQFRKELQKDDPKFAILKELGAKLRKRLLIRQKDESIETVQAELTLKNADQKIEQDQKNQNYSRESYNHQVFEYKEKYYIVMQQCYSPKQKDSSCKMSFSIYEYNLTTKWLEIVHEGVFFQDIGFDFFTEDNKVILASPQPQAFIQHGQYLCYVTLERDKSDKFKTSNNDLDLQFVFQKFDITTRQLLKVKEFPINLSDNQIPFYMSFCAKYDSKQSIISLGQGKSTFVSARKTQELSEEDMLDTFVLVWYYDGNCTGRSKFKHEIRHLKLFEMPLQQLENVNISKRLHIYEITSDKKLRIDYINYLNNDEAFVNQVFDINKDDIAGDVTLTQIQEEEIDEDKDHGKDHGHGHGHHHHHHGEEDKDPDNPHDQEEYFDRIMKQYLQNCPLQIKTIVKQTNQDTLYNNEILFKQDKNIEYILEQIHQTQEKLKTNCDDCENHYTTFDSPAQMEVTFILDYINNKLVIIMRKLTDAIHTELHKARFMILQTPLVNNCKVVDSKRQTFLNNKNVSYFSREFPNVFSFQRKGHCCTPQQHLCLYGLKKHYQEPEGEIDAWYMQQGRSMDDQEIRLEARYMEELRGIEQKRNHFLNKTIVRDGALLQQDLIDGIRKYKIVVKSKPFQKNQIEIESDEFEIVIESSNNINSDYDPRQPIETVFIQHQLKEFDQHQVPVMIFQGACAYLLLIDLSKLEIQQRIMIDINEMELGQICQKSLVCSSELYCTYDQVGKIIYMCQNYHACFVFNNIQRMLLIEFRIEWQVDKHDVLKSHMTVMARKEIMFNYAPIVMSNCFIGCLCDRYNLIHGLKVNIHDKDGVLFYLDLWNNFRSNCTIQAFDNELTQTRYTKYMKNEHMLKLEAKKAASMESGSCDQYHGPIALLVESKIKELVLNTKGYRQYEISQNLRWSITTVLNMRQSSLEEYLLKHMNVDVFQNIESLLGLSHSDLLIKTPQNFQNRLIKKQQKLKFQCEGGAPTRSLIEQMTDNENVEENRKFYAKTGLLRNFREHSFDLTYSFTFERCLLLMIEYLEIEEKKIENQLKKQNLFSTHEVQVPKEIKQTIEIIAKQIQKSYTVSHYHMMMIMLPQFLDCQATMVPKRYFEFLSTFRQDNAVKLFMQHICCTSADKTHLNNTNIGFRMWFNQESVTQFDIQNEVEKYIQSRARHQIKSDIDYQQYYIEFRQITLHSKNRLIQSNQFDKATFQDKHFTQDSLIILIYEIYQRIGNNILEYPFIQKIIDQDYYKTEKMFLVKIVLYMIFYFIPLLYQFFTASKQGIYISLISCMSMQIFLLYLETLQMRLEGLGYFSDIWNLIDMTNFGVNCIFWVWRIMRIDSISRIIIENVYGDYTWIQLRQFSSKEMMEKVSMQSEKTIDPVLCIMSILLIFVSFMKVMFFLQSCENFGKISVLVQLVSYCVKDVMPVMVFMIGWITFFCFVQSFLGVQIDDTDYKDVSYINMMFIQTWRISIGDIIVPNHNYWVNDMYSENMQTLMVSLIWIFWFLNHFIILIILLNVLIAILSDSFELAQSQMTQNKYSNRVHLNREISAYYKNDGIIDCILVSLDKENEGDNWGGFVSSIKSFIKKETNDLKEGILTKILNNLGNQDERMEEMDEKMEALTENQTTITNKLDQIWVLLETQFKGQIPKKKKSKA